MVSFVLQAVFESSGRKPSADSSFAAIGVDSLAAVMFRSYISKSLGGITIDQEKLFDPDCTITSFSEDLYQRTKESKPHILATLNITKAVNNNDITSDQPKHIQTTLNKLLLFNRLMTDGYRGILIILIIYDHVFLKTAENGSRVHADTYLFIVLTGFTTTLQSIDYADSCHDTNTKGSQWNFSQFLSSRLLGLIPLYWVSIALCVPRVIINLPSANLSSGGLALLYLLYIFALNDWTDWCGILMTDLYYVSLILGVFFIYALYKSAYHLESFPKYVQYISYFLISGFVIGMGFFPHAFSHPGGGGNIPPPIGFAYFVLGGIAGHLFNYLISKNLFGIYIIHTVKLILCFIIIIIMDYYSDSYYYY